MFAAQEIPDEDWASFNLERLKEAHPHFPWSSWEKDELYRYFLALIGFSPYITNILVQRKDILELFLNPKSLAPKGQRALQKELILKLSAFKEWREVAFYLRQIKQREITKILFWDLAGRSFLRTVFSLTNLAEACLQAIIFWLNQQYNPKGSLLVLGMGKLGARELNYSSDIDLIYLYKGPFSQKEYMIRLARDLTKLVDSLVAGERIFRVDLRLRPGGKDGELVCSLKGALNYYSFQSHPFERLALLKARACAGDKKIGKKFLSLLRPVIFPRYLDYTYLEHIADLKKRISKEAFSIGWKDIKIGPGGIREVEFFCQAFQMIYGGKFPILRTRNTLWIIYYLEKTSLLSPQEALFLRKAYLLLRTLEHRLQTIHFTRTFKLPEESAAWSRLAKSMGFKGENSGADLKKILYDYRKKVQEIFSNLFLSSQKSFSQAKLKTEAFYLTQEIPTKDLAQELGISEEVLEEIRSLVKGSSKRAHLLSSFLPKILEEILKIKDQKKAIKRLVSFVHRLGGRFSFFHALKHRPQTIEDLILIFSQSSYLTHLLMEAPLAAEALLEPEPLEKEIRRAIRSRTYEDALSLLRAYKNESLFRIGLKDLQRKITLQRLLNKLSSLAFLVIEETFRISQQRLGEEMGRLLSGGLAIFGLGKLGSKEMGYRSDLDMLFVYEGSGQREDIVYATKIIQRFLSYLTMHLPEGPGYQVDTRLRPEGRKGPLVIPKEAFFHYYQHKADFWEKLALVRLCFITGDRKLAQEILQGLKKILAQKEYNLSIGQKLFDMRLFMERERTKKGYFNLKVGYGGLADIEFIVHWLVLKNLYQNKEILIGNIFKALFYLKEKNILSLADYSFLKRSYTFLRSLDQKLILILDKPGEDKQYSEEEIKAMSKFLDMDVWDKYNYYIQKNRKLLEKFLIKETC